MKNTHFTHILLSSAVALILTACGGGNGGSSDGGGGSGSKGSPTITINGNENMVVDLGKSFTDPGATATDEKDGDLTNSITVSDINTSIAGEQTLTYSVTDSDGKSATATRIVSVEYNSSKLPLDTNTLFDKDNKYIYFANPQSNEGGHNSVVRIDYKNMVLDGEIVTNGINPHSIDRAGNTDKFYVRTQNSNSFEIVSFKDNTAVSKTIEFSSKTLSGTNPRSIGSYNAKYNLQLLAGKHRPIIALIDVTTDEIVGVAGDDSVFDAGKTYSGHGIWFDENYFGIISQNANANGNYIIKMYKITDDGSRNFTIVDVGSAMAFSTKLHAIERVLDPQTADDLTTFYALGASKAGGFPPNVTKIKFDPKNGLIDRSKTATWLAESNTTIDGISPATHHGNITPDHKYYVTPVTDGKVYFIDRKTMNVSKMIDTNTNGTHNGLGAAHAEFSAAQKVALVTNHFSNYLTIIDMSDSNVANYSIKAQIKIGEHAFAAPPAEKHLMQPHFAMVSEDGKYFYTAASHDGVFVRVDLEKLKDATPADYNNIQRLKDLGILKTITIGGVIEQSHS